MESLKIVGPQPVVHKIGNLYKDTSDGSLSILAQTSYYEVALISLNAPCGGMDAGNRFREPVKVSDIKSLTSDEWDAIQDGGYVFVGRCGE